MNAKEHQDGEMEETQVPHDLADRTKPADESRRSFAKSGLAASGVLLTLASRPVLAGVCRSPSGFLSGNASAHGTPQTCSGLTPGFWQAPDKSWPNSYTKGTCINVQHPSSNDPLDWTGGTAFSGTFSCNNKGLIYKRACLPNHHPQTGCTNTSPLSLMQVLLLIGKIDFDQLGAHIVAALLNAAAGLTPVLTEAQVINMFNEWDQNGYFEPTAGVKWYGGDIVTYLKTTMS